MTSSLESPKNTFAAETPVLSGLVHGLFELFQLIISRCWTGEVRQGGETVTKYNLKRFHVRLSIMHFDSPNTVG